LIDLDDFKDINDTLGHDAGDALLKETAARLSLTTRDRDTVARLGGDEFAVLVAEPLKWSHATSLAESIIKKLRQPFHYAGRSLVSRASIGVALFPDHDSAPVELMKDADIALYRAKAEGRGRVVMYSPEMRAAAEQRLALGRDVREALSGNQIVPFYQPKICLSTGRIVGVEALARWQHPEKGILTPGVFGAVFDDPELATAIGKRLIGKIASDMRRWLDRGINFGRVAFNLSSVEFSQADLADEILRILKLVKVPAEHLEVEVTERVLLDGRSGLVSETLDKFHRQGVQIALDDFGTGYASLTHLKQFPVDHIKIDHSFIAGLEHDENDAAIVAAVVSLGRSLGLQVTAEGVEKEGQARLLREMGCHNSQGYYFAKPMAPSHIAELLCTWPERKDVGFKEAGDKV
jgi:diguanylate cyclase (GGDEF)-like protein